MTNTTDTTTPTCVLCGAENTSRTPEKYPYCAGCHYTGEAANAIRSEQVERFRRAFPGATVGVEHTGGGCFWLAFHFGDDPVYYVATDGEASLPAVHDGDDVRALPEGGWGYVGRHDDTEDEGNEDYEGTIIAEPNVPDGGDFFETYPAHALTDEQVVAAIRADRERRLR